MGKILKAYRDSLTDKTLEDISTRIDETSTLISYLETELYEWRRSYSRLNAIIAHYGGGPEEETLTAVADKNILHLEESLSRAEYFKQELLKYQNMARRSKDYFEVTDTANYLMTKTPEKFAQDSSLEGISAIRKSVYELEGYAEVIRMGPPELSGYAEVICM